MTRPAPTSEKLLAEAERVMPGGVSSPVRAYGAVGGKPRFILRGSGPYLTDVDGNTYIDYVLSWGPLILGHAPPSVASAIREALQNGTSYGAPTPQEIQLARMIVEAIPSVEMVRFVNSGTEATMSAVRLARAYTQRDRILKFDGCYHGHADSLLVEAGSGVATLGIPGSAGVTEGVAKDTLSLPYNDLETVEEVFRERGEEIAAVIAEPVAGNMGVVPPHPGFLEGLRRVTSDHRALLVFDEVITGFRVAYGGAQTLFGVEPDLTCLGKIIGGGLPVGAYGGRREIMDRVAPSGPVYQAGTLSGNPLAMAAGIATLQALQEPGTYERLEERAVMLTEGIGEAAEAAGVPIRQTRVGSMFSTFFTEAPVTDYATAKASDADRYATFFWGMLDGGIYLAPSPFESGFLSTAHTEAEIEATVRAARRALGGVSSLIR